MGANSAVNNCEICENSMVEECVVWERWMGRNVKIGGFGEMRPD